MAATRVPVVLPSWALDALAMEADRSGEAAETVADRIIREAMPALVAEALENERYGDPEQCQPGIASHLPPDAERRRLTTGACSNAVTISTVEPHATGFDLDIEDAPGGDPG